MDGAVHILAREMASIASRPVDVECAGAQLARTRAAIGVTLVTAALTCVIVTFARVTLDRARVTVALAHVGIDVAPMAAMLAHVIAARAFLATVSVKKFVDETIPAGTKAAIYEVRAIRSTKTGPVATFNVNFGTSGERVQKMQIAA